MDVEPRRLDECRCVGGDDLTLNLLSLWPERLFRTKQSPARRQYLRALAARPDVNLIQSGPGFPNWDCRLTGMQNIDRIMPECHAVISYKAVAGCELGSIREPMEVCQKILTVEQFNECHAGFPGGVDVMHPGGGTAAQECAKVGIRLIVLHHENDRHRMKSCEDYGARIVHIPHCADLMFAEESRLWNERSGVILTGVLNEHHYPLRQRWYNLIQSGRIKGAYFRRPGNYTQSVEESDRLVREYAKALGSARVKLGCSSRWRYQLAHFSESAMAGTVQVSDVPECAPDAGKMILAVEPDASDDELVSAVEYALAHAEELGRQAQHAVLAGYTTAHYAERLVTAIREML